MTVKISRDIVITGSPHLYNPLNPGVIDTDMLRSCRAEGAASFPKAEAWAKTAAPFILKLGAKDNGQSLSVGGDED